MQWPGSIRALLTQRNIFWLTLFCMVISLLALSLDAGISGDEPVHYAHAEMVNNYYLTEHSDTSSLYTPETNLSYYGQVFDNISQAINQATNSKHPYQNRHLINALLGFLLILFTSLITKDLGGYSAATLTALFMFFSPRILGHSLNNMKDIPFALGYMLSIWGLVKSMIDYPKIKWPNLLAISIGLAIAFGTRAGGLVLIPVILFFSFLNWLNYFLHSFREIKTWINGSILLACLLASLLLGYLLGVLYWPFALQDIVHNPLKALSMMTHYEVSIRTVFNGHWLWSEKLPWFYGLKWILISSPLVILLGFVGHIFSKRKSAWPLTSLLIFAALFPIVWTIIKNSNLYGGWRHLIFVYPSICIISALTWSQLYMQYQKLIWRASIVSLLILGLLGPVLHIIRNHPLEYVYFNRLVGGVKGANGRFETDYYFHGIRQAADWLEQTLVDSADQSTIKVASNFPLNDYDEYLPENFQIQYFNYYNRGKYDWDYGIFSSTNIDPIQIQKGFWPPLNTIYEVKVDGIPVCVVVKRNSDLDLQALKAYRKSQFIEADSLYKLHLAKYPEHETSLLYAAWTKRQLELYQESGNLANKLLSIHPLSDNGLDLLARNAISTGNYRAAIAFLNQLLLNNYKYRPAYEQMGIAYDRLGKREEAEKFRMILNKL